MLSDTEMAQRGHAPHRALAWAPLLLLLLAAGCNKAAANADKVMVELRAIMLEESDPENQPATEANRAMANLRALPYAELLALAENTDSQGLLRTLDGHKNFNIIAHIRTLHAANNSQVVDIVARLAELPVAKEGGPSEPLAARVVMTALQALG